METKSSSEDEKLCVEDNSSISIAKSLHQQFSCQLQIFVYHIKTRTLPVYCYPIATILSFLLISKTQILEDVPAAFGIGIASYLLGLATYIYNDLTDIDDDHINRKEQSVVTQNQSRRGLIIIVIFMFGLAATISYIISSSGFLISIIFIILCIFYSHPKFSLKSKFRLKTIVTATGVGLLSLLGGVAAIGNVSDYDTLRNTTIFPYQRSTWHFHFRYSILFNHQWVILLILRGIELPVGTHFH